jgi:NAD(P)H dehydrogenase (quinone)
MILVTSAAGKTGQAVLKALSNSGQQTRAFIHTDEQKAAVLDLEATEVIVGDLMERKAVNQAVKGIEAIYLICPNTHQREFEICVNFIKAAQRAGVRRLVYHSVMFPQVEAMPHHWQKLRVEEAIIQSGLEFTILQPASYMQNLLPYWEAILKEGKYTVPYSTDSVFSPVDLEEVAIVAGKVLTEKAHASAIYQLVGPECLSSNQMADQISVRLGRKIAAQTQPLEKWIEGAKKRGLDAYALETLSKMFAYYDRFGFAGSNQTLKHLLGQQPNSFGQFLGRLSSR